MLWLTCTGIWTVGQCNRSAAVVTLHPSRLRQLRRSLLARLGHVQVGLKRGAPHGGCTAGARPLASCLDHTSACLTVRKAWQ